MLMRASRLWGAVHRICRAHGQRVLIDMIPMNMVQNGHHADNRRDPHGEPLYARSWGHAGEYGWDGVSRCRWSWCFILFFCCASDHSFLEACSKTFA